MAADGINYEDAVIVTKLIKVKDYDGDKLEMEISFPIFAEIVYCEGVDVTYSYKTNLALEGKKVLANIHYAKRNMYDGKVPDDTLKVKGFKGFLKDPLKSAEYQEVVKLTKEKALSTYKTELVKGKEEQVAVPYLEADKDTAYPFCISNAMKLEEVVKLKSSRRNYNA